MIQIDNDKFLKILLGMGLISFMIYLMSSI